jgi:hypothetical protein
MLGHHIGIDMISSQIGRPFDCHQALHALYPNHSRALLTVADLQQQAYMIYLMSASVNPPIAASTALVEHFKNTLESLPPSSPGAHVLVWAVFIAASASQTSEQREFFTDYLHRQHQRNGFSNIPRSLEYLESTHQRGSRSNWTSRLPEPQIFVI